MLGMNRCIAICYYGTKARSLNRVSVAVGCSLSTWLIGVGAALVGTFSQPMIGIQRSMWSISFLEPRPHTTLFFSILCAANLFGLSAQWICSTLVLLKIRQVKKKISRNKLNQNSANRFRKQARLTFQFFYPSILCTISTFLFFIKPYAYEYLSGWQLVILHMSRDFEQLCEFIMRVNPLYDSSEGWRESSDEEPFQPEFTKELDSTHNQGGGGLSRYDNEREAKSIVLDLGRQTVEHWVKFAKKASI
uniref:7TM_GPCR_Srx domain-containing protein n=2 Tax=Caenorhabditis japonica TaxID=281687 RepID=A0A8R1I197_CAEJA